MMINESIDKKLVALFGVADPEKSRLERAENLRLQDEILSGYYQRFEADSRMRYPENGFMALVDAHRTAPAPLILYGAGGFLMNSLRKVMYLGMRPDFLCDRNEQKALENPFGLKALSLDELIRGHTGSYLLAVTGHYWIYNDMLCFLVSLGFPCNRIYNTW